LCRGEPNKSSIIVCKTEHTEQAMSEATLIVGNMRGGCATVGTTVHTLFRLTGSRKRTLAMRENAEADLSPKQRVQPQTGGAAGVATENH
jgi:hypothetical protein